MRGIRGRIGWTQKDDQREDMIDLPSLLTPTPKRRTSSSARWIIPPPPYLYPRSCLDFMDPHTHADPKKNEFRLCLGRFGIHVFRALLGHS